MALNATNFVNQGPIRSADMKQFVDLFTGVMTDQPITFKNATQLGGNQGAATAPLKLFGVVGQTSHLVETYPTSGAASPTFGLNALGGHAWGPGSPAAFDTFMSRIALQNGHATDTPGLWITPGIELPVDSLNGSCLIDQTITADKLATDVGGTVIHEEFLPTNGATSVTVAQNPTGVIYVSRNGIVQSTTDGHYTISVRVFNFSTPFDGTERVSISYSVGPVGSAGLVDQSVTNVKLAPDTARLNLLTNGGFEIWQRGNGPIAPVLNVAYGPDRWMIQTTGSSGGTTISVSRNTADVDANSRYCAAATYTPGTGDTTPSIWQEFGLNDGLVQQLIGKAVTFSIRVKTSIAGVRPWMMIGGARTYGAAHTANGQYQTLTITGTLTTSELSGGFYCGIGFTPGTGGAAYLDNAMLVVGSVPADYAPLHPADDLARCQRYYETFIPGGAGQTFSFAMGSGTGGCIGPAHHWKVTKAVTPTITFVGGQNIQIGNGSAAAATPSVANVTPNFVHVNYGVATANGQMYGVHVASAGSGWLIEGNP